MKSAILPTLDLDAFKSSTFIRKEKAMDAFMAPQDDLAPEIVRAVRAGKPLTVDQLVATGQDIEVFADA